jgi:hypothetical protein
MELRERSKDAAYLQNKFMLRFVRRSLDTKALAEFLIALQHAASVVLDGASSTVTAAPSPNPPPPPDEPPGPAGS